MKHRHLSALSILLIFSLALGIFTFSFEEPYAASKKPEYIAHRGWSAKAPENTLAAFKLAAKNENFYGVEFDIWESKAEKSVVKTKTVIDEDGNAQTVEVKADPLLLVMHDENIKRMCGVNKSIRSITRANRKKYTIKSGANVRKYSGQKIPTVNQALKRIYKYSNGAIPVIELKHRLSKRALKYLIKLIDGRRAVIISFDYDAVNDAAQLIQKKGLSESIQTMYLMNSLSSGKYKSMAKKLKKAGIDCISLNYTKVSKATVKAFHNKGIKVCIWTVPNKSTAKKYAKMGVDYITANGAVY